MSSASVASRPARTARGGGSDYRSSRTPNGASRAPNSYSSNGAANTNGRAVASDESDELRALRLKYSGKLASLKELFPGWTDEDLLFVLNDVNGSLETAIGRISEGHAVQWGEVNRKKDKKQATPVSHSPRGGAGRGAGRGGSRAHDDFPSTRGGARGGRGGGGVGRGGGRGSGRFAGRDREANGPSSSTEAINASAWGATEDSSNAGGWGAAPTDAAANDAGGWGAPSAGDATGWGVSGDPATETSAELPSASTNDAKRHSEASAPATNGHPTPAQKSAAVATPSAPKSSAPPAPAKLSWAQIAKPKDPPKPQTPLPPTAIPTAPALTPSSLPPSQPVTEPHTNQATPSAEPPREPTPPPTEAVAESSEREEPTTASGPTWDDDPAQAWAAHAQGEPTEAEEEPVQTASEPEVTEPWQDPAIVSMSSNTVAAAAPPPTAPAPATPASVATDAPNISAQTPSLASTTATAATSAAPTPSIASLSSPPGLSSPATPGSPSVAASLAAGIVKPSTPVGLSRKGLNRFKSSGESPVMLPSGVGVASSPFSFGTLGGSTDPFMRFGSLSLGGDEQTEAAPAPEPAAAEEPAASVNQKTPQPAPTALPAQTVPAPTPQNETLTIPVSQSLPAQLRETPAPLQQQAPVQTAPSPPQTTLAHQTSPQPQPVAAQSHIQQSPALSNLYQSQQQSAQPTPSQTQPQAQSSHLNGSSSTSSTLYSSLHQYGAASQPQQQHIAQPQPQTQSHHTLESRLSGLGSSGLAALGNGIGSSIQPQTSAAQQPQQQAAQQAQQTHLQQQHAQQAQQQAQQQQTGAGYYGGRPDHSSYYGTPQSAGLGGSVQAQQQQPPQQTQSHGGPQDLGGSYGIHDQFGGLGGSAIGAQSHQLGAGGFSGGIDYGLYNEPRDSYYNSYQVPAFPSRDSQDESKALFQSAQPSGLGAQSHGPQTQPSSVPPLGPAQGAPPAAQNQPQYPGIPPNLYYYPQHYSQNPYYGQYGGYPPQPQYMKYGGMYQQNPALPQQQQPQNSGLQSTGGQAGHSQQKTGPYGSLYPEYDDYNQGPQVDAYASKQPSTGGPGQSQQGLYGQGLQGYLSSGAPSQGAAGGPQSQGQVPRNTSPESSYKPYQSSSASGAGGPGGAGTNGSGVVQDKSGGPTGAGVGGSVANVQGGPAGRGGVPQPQAGGAVPRGVGAGVGVGGVGIQQPYGGQQGGYFRGGYGGGGGQQQQQAQQQQQGQGQGQGGNARPYHQPDQQQQYYQTYPGAQYWQ